MSDVMHTNMENSAAVNEQAEKPRKSKHRLLLILPFIFLLLLIAGAVLAYLHVAEFYEAHFFATTTFNGISCDEYTVEEVADIFNAESIPYSLLVYGRNPENPDEETILGTITQEDMLLHYQDVSDEVALALEEQVSWLWACYLVPKDWTWLQNLMNLDVPAYTVTRQVCYDADALALAVDNIAALWEENFVMPTAASLSAYAAEEGGYVVAEATQGTALDAVVAKKLITEAAISFQEEIHLEAYDLYETAEGAFDEDTLYSLADLLNTWTSTCITYDWTGHEVVLDGETIATWITVTQEGEALLDEEAVAAFVSQQKALYDTYGQYRQFQTVYGDVITLTNVRYGWLVDAETELEELLALIYAGEITEREPVYTYTAYAKGDDDIGDSYVEIDLTAQHLYLHIDGEIVLDTDFVSGNVQTGNTTPGGLFGITYKTRDVTLRGADYATPVSYWMPFNGGIGMHDATWRSKFGGDIYLTNGSHGCINLPYAMAKQIYSYVEAGFPVVCYYLDTVKTLAEEATQEQSQAEVSENAQTQDAEAAEGAEEEEAIIAGAY